MNNNPLTILAINPGTRYTGIAILKGSDLLDWGIKSISGRWSDKKLEKIRDMISELIAEYQPHILAVKSLHSSRSSRHLDQVSREIIKMARAKRLRICEHTLEEMETFYDQGGKATRNRMVELVCSRHPVLLRELRKEQSHSNPYHIRMFEAVALGTLAAVRAGQELI